MKCNECKEAISAYYDKVLDEKQKTEVEVHLKQCPSCQNEYIQLKQMLGYLKEINQEETVVPPLLHKKMLEKVAKETHSIKVRSLWPQRIGGMAAALLVGVILVKVYPLDLNEMDGKAENYVVAAQDAAPSPIEEPIQTEVSNSMKTSNGVTAARITPKEHEMAGSKSSLESTNQMAESSNVIVDKAAGQDENSLKNETTQIQESRMNGKNAENLQIWEIETEEVELLTTYLQDYAEENDATVKMQDEAEQVSFSIYNIADIQALFESLQAQGFTKSLMIIEETGENIKIIVKA